MKNVLLAVLLITIAGIMIVAYFNMDSDPDTQPSSGEDETLYHDERLPSLGIAFSYRAEPDSYTVVIVSTDRDDVEGFDLFDSDEFEELLEAIERGDAREGPTSISVRAFQNPDNRTVREWMEEDPRSNFITSDMQVVGQGVQETNLAGKDATEYTWSGLYEGRTIALSHDGRIFTFSVTYTSPEDDILEDFDTFLESVQFMDNTARSDQVIGFIRSFEPIPNSSSYILSFNEAVFLSGEEARATAIEDGHDPDEVITNDHYISDKDEGTREYRADQTTRIEVFDPDSQENSELRELTPSEFSRVFNENTQQYSTSLFSINASRGTVRLVTEQ